MAKRWITSDDFIDVYHKFIQRGSGFIFSKLNPKAHERTKSAFNETAVSSSNWWIIPKVRQRWNEKITGDSHLMYEDYVVEKHLSKASGLRLLSIGSGVCSHEIRFAGYASLFSEVVCCDLVESLLATGKANAEEQGIKNMNFVSGDIAKIQFEEGSFDAILFHSSLHHMLDIQLLIETKIKRWLKPKGLLLLNEYVGVNRLQYPSSQLRAINEAIQLIPKEMRQRFMSNQYKNNYQGSGYLRMIIADPTECAESEEIIPSIKKHFDTIEENPYGGNLLMPVLKDISHHFISSDTKIERTLDILFDAEDQYLEHNVSDFVFGVYKKN